MKIHQLSRCPDLQGSGSILYRMFHAEALQTKIHHQTVQANMHLVHSAQRRWSIEFEVKQLLFS